MPNVQLICVNQKSTSSFWPWIIDHMRMGMVTGPTQERGNTLDFILAICPEYFTDINTNEELFPSDLILWLTLVK